MTSPNPNYRPHTPHLNQPSSTQHAKQQLQIYKNKASKLPQKTTNKVSLPVTTHQQCLCSCKGRRKSYKPAQRYWSYAYRHTGTCRCPDLQNKSWNWCQCAGRQIIGSSTCRCRCGGLFCRSRHVCRCMRGKLNRCRCFGIRSTYRVGHRLESNRGLCIPIPQISTPTVKQQGSISAVYQPAVTSTSTSDCQCTCSGLRYKHGHIAVRVERQQTGQCQCDDLKTHSTAWCRCSGVGVLPRDTCQCQCQGHTCPRQYRCNCFHGNNKCRCGVIWYRSYYNKGSSSLCVATSSMSSFTQPVVKKRKSCYCRCRGQTQYVAQYRRKVYTNYGRCSCNDLSQGQQGMCRCWGKPFDQR